MSNICKCIGIFLGTITQNFVIQQFNLSQFMSTSHKMVLQTTFLLTIVKKKKQIGKTRIFCYYFTQPSIMITAITVYYLCINLNIQCFAVFIFNPP